MVKVTTLQGDGNEFFVSKWMQFFGDGWSTKIRRKIGYHMNNSSVIYERPKNAWKFHKNILSSKLIIFS